MAERLTRDMVQQADYQRANRKAARRGLIRHIAFRMGGPIVLLPLGALYHVNPAFVPGWLSLGLSTWCVFAATMIAMGKAP